jgi:hypothetical protein
MARWSNACQQQQQRQQQQQQAVVEAGAQWRQLLVGVPLQAAPLQLSYHT